MILNLFTYRNKNTEKHPYLLHFHIDKPKHGKNTLKKR